MAIQRIQYLDKYKVNITIKLPHKNHDKTQIPEGKYGTLKDNINNYTG
jgi:hypothetical protein